MEKKNLTDNNIDSCSTREKILSSAAKLFAVKGYSETSLRELSAVVGIRAASIYNHFPSKNSILEEMLNDYSENTYSVYHNLNLKSILRENPNTEGILNCMQLAFPKGKIEYYLNVLSVILQEQHRNPTACSTARQIIIRAEMNIKDIINTLKEIGVVQQDTDPDYWMKVCASLIYTFANRMTMGIGDNMPDFTGNSMTELLKATIDMMFEKHGVH